MYNHLCLRDLVLTEKFLDTRTEAVTKAVCFNVGALAVQLPELHGTALAKLQSHIVKKKHKHAHIAYIFDLILIAIITYYAAVDRAA